MSRTRVQHDEDGVFVECGGERYAPGPLIDVVMPGLRSDAEGLAIGAVVDVTPLECVPVVRLDPEGCEPLFWQSTTPARATAAGRTRGPFRMVDGRNVPHAYAVAWP